MARGFTAILSISLAITVRSVGDEFHGLGDLPGGQFESHAFGVSADGTTVVGHSFSANGDKEAFRWTKTDGMLGLGDLQTLRADSRANATSRDGTVVVGSGRSGTKKGTMGSTTAFRWTKAEGMRRPRLVARPICKQCGTGHIGRWYDNSRLQYVRREFSKRSISLDQGSRHEGTRRHIARRKRREHRECHFQRCDDNRREQRIYEGRVSLD